MRIIDMHCDTVMALMDTDKNLRRNDLMIDLEKLQKGDYLLQCFAMFVPYESRKEGPYSPFEYCHKMIDRYYLEMDQNRDLIRPVLTYNDLLENRKNGYLSSLLTIEEGGVCLGNLEFLRNFYRLGVRMITLTWNFKNEIATPNINYSALKNMPKEEAIETMRHPNTTEGLTEFGIAFVKEMNRLGMVIDCSHLGDAGFYDVIRYSEKPIVCSHSCARSVCNHVRNMTDDMLDKLKENGGVVGINYCHDFVISEGRDATIDDIVRHIVYIRDRIGIDHIGFGSDFDGISNEDLELKDASGMPAVLDALRREGFTEEDIEKICCRNVMRVLEANLK